MTEVFLVSLTIRLTKTEVDPFNTVTSIFEDNEMEVTADAATETEAE